MERCDVAAALAVLLRGEDKRVFTFSDRVVEVAAYDGLPGISQINNSQLNNGTQMAAAVGHINTKVPCDRLIVLTDEQGTDGRVPDPLAPLAYMVNVGSYRHGIGYGKWTHIDGFSENVLRYLHELEATFAMKAAEPVAE